MYTINALATSPSGLRLVQLAAVTTPTVASFVARQMRHRLSRSLIICRIINGRIIKMVAEGKFPVGRAATAHGLLPVWLEPDLTLSAGWTLVPVVYETVGGVQQRRIICTAQIEQFESLPREIPIRFVV